MNTPPTKIPGSVPAIPSYAELDTESTYSLRHRHRPWVAHQKLVALSFLGDAAVVFLSLLSAYLVRFETGLASVGVYQEELSLQSYLGHVLFGGLMLQALLVNFRLHDPRNFLAIRRTVMVICRAAGIWLLLFLSVTLMLKIEPAISRLYCVIGAFMAVSGLIGWRWVLYCILRQEPIASALRQKVVFVGWNRECRNSIERFSEGRARQLKMMGVVTPRSGNCEEEVPENVPTLGNYEDVRRILRDSGADVVMAVDGALSHEEKLALAETCGKEFVDFKLVPSCFQVLVSGLQMESFHGMPVLGVGKLPLHHGFNTAAKRLIDLLGAVIGLAVFAPVIAFFMVLVWIESPGAVIYRQRRIGLNGRPFDILKIRSMRPDAESDGEVGWTVENDPRRLRVGEFMRKWNIDELPQFWNVLNGEMSLVGPRPERPELIEGFKENIRYYNVRHNVKPGVTGWAQVNGLRGDTCLRERVKFDLHYIEHWNMLLDLRIMLMTFLNRKGAC